MRHVNSLSVDPARAQYSNGKKKSMGKVLGVNNNALKNFPTANTLLHIKTKSRQKKLEYETQQFFVIEHMPQKNRDIQFKASCDKIFTKVKLREHCTQ